VPIFYFRMKKYTASTKPPIITSTPTTIDRAVKPWPDGAAVGVGTPVGVRVGTDVGIDVGAGVAVGVVVGAGVGVGVGVDVGVAVAWLRPLLPMLPGFTTLSPLFGLPLPGLPPELVLIISRFTLTVLLFAVNVLEAMFPL